MIRPLRRLWWRLRRHGRPWAQAEAEALVLAELERCVARLQDATLPPQTAYGSVAATLLAQLYAAHVVQGKAEHGAAALQQVFTAVGARIATLTGHRPFEVQTPPTSTPTPPDGRAPTGPPPQP